MNHITTLDPVYTYVTQPGKLAEAQAFAARRCDFEAVNDHSPDSTQPTIPVAPQAA